MRAVEHQELALRDTKREELEWICAMEQGEAKQFIIPYPLERHLLELSKPDVVYKTIWQADEPVGFVMLVLDPDGRSVEFRRIVVSKPGHGYGKRVVRMVDEVCRNALGRSRVWLDVFETNARARHVYERCGYRRFGSGEHGGRALLLYENSA